MGKRMLISLYIVLSVMLAVIPVNAQSENVMKIGVIGPLESSAGAGIKWAADMAAREINENGGILGKQVELVFGNTDYKPELGAYEYSKMVKDDKVAAVIGTASSGVALKVMEQMARYKVPFLATGALSPKVTEQVEMNYEKYKYLFRICEGSLDSAVATSDWVINYLVPNHNVKKAALMIESAEWTTPIAKEVEKRLKNANIEVPVFEYFYKQTTDLKPILSKIIASKADMVFVVSGHVDSVKYVNDWADMKGPIMVGITASASTIWKASGGKVLSMVELTTPGLTALTYGKAFYEKYTDKYKTSPEYTSPYTYDALYILKSAMEAAKSEKPDAVAAELEKTDFKGISGRWVFDKKSHDSKFGLGYRQLLMAQWQESGKICIVWPEDVSNCKFILPPWLKK